MIGAAAASSIGVTKGFSTGEAGSFCRRRTAVLPDERQTPTSIVASFSRKPASTRSASAAISVFLAARFLWTQSAASSADWSWPRSASNCSRSAADCSGPRTVRGRTDDLLPAARSRRRGRPLALPPRLVAVARLRRPCQRRRLCWRRPPSRLRQGPARRDRPRRRCRPG